MSIAFVFSGQGAQYVGMGKELYENYEEVREIFDTANKALELNLKEVCFEGPKEDLNDTENTQPALLTLSMAITKLLELNSIKASMVAGLSLGEYGALVYSGALSFEEAIKLVKKRGKYMKESIPEGNYGMVAVLGLSNEAVEEICEKYREKGHIYPANYNCPGQLVVGGELEVINLAKEEFKAAGAKRVLELEVSSPFHTPLLEGAATKLKNELCKVDVKEPQIPVISNVYAKEHSIEDLKDTLAKHVISPVKFEQSVKYMIEKGVDVFIEIGPGKVLSGFIKKIDKSVTIFNIEDMESLQKTIEGIKN